MLGNESYIIAGFYQALWLLMEYAGVEGRMSWVKIRTFIELVAKLHCLMSESEDSLSVLFSCP